jgi:putative ABC transport system permease protein
MITRIALEKIPTRWLIRITGDPMRAAPAIRRAVLAVDATQPATDFETLEETLSLYIAANRFNMLMLSIFALLALVLAVIGVYGLMSYSVSQRTREMGVRVALGARPGDLVRGLVWQGAKLGFAGIGAGLAGSALLNRFLQSLLYGVQASDAMTFVSVACLLILVLLLANFVPAMGAASIQPLIALREE